MVVSEAARVVTFGEAMAQVIPVDGDIESATAFDIASAGGESNTAITLSRLGTFSAWVGLLGDDPLGRRIVHELAALDVDTGGVRLVAGERTGVFFKQRSASGSAVYYYREAAAARLMTPDDVALNLGGAAWMHVTAVTPALSESCAETVAASLRTAAQRGIRTSFDVNYRPVLWSRREDAAEKLLELGRLADTLFVGLDEADSLWQTHTPADVRALFPTTGEVVVKNGGSAAVAYADDTEFIAEPPKVEVVELVGAGDAFAAGWIHARLKGFDPLAALRLGHLVAACALRSIRDHGPLPASPSDLERLAQDPTAELASLDGLGLR